MLEGFGIQDLAGGGVFWGLGFRIQCNVGPLYKHVLAPWQERLENTGSLNPKPYALNPKP